MTSLIARTFRPADAEQLHASGYSPLLARLLAARGLLGDDPSERELVEALHWANEKATREARED